MLRVLHLEDHKDDAYFIQQALSQAAIQVNIVLAKNASEYKASLESQLFDLILADHSMPSFSGLEAMAIARRKFPGIPFICVSGNVHPKQVEASLAAGATDYVFKNHLPELVASVQRVHETLQLKRQNQGMTRLVSAIQELSLARDLETIMAIVRRAARELTGADGATFVLHEDGYCYYADEDAIAPLWKGQRFPMNTCISGWAMLNRQPAVIEDIYADSRIPAVAYRPTFVKSLAMVPIRTVDPIGAIGNYWAHKHMPNSQEVELLQALANTTAVAMENVRVYAELEQRVKSRTSELEAANKELETFSYAVSHDLGAPLRSIHGYSDLLLRQCADKLDQEPRLWLSRIGTSSEHMQELIDDLLRLSKVARGDLNIEQVNLSELASLILSGFAADPERKVELNIQKDIIAEGDRGLLHIALENLLSNAWKYSSKNPHARIEFGIQPQSDKSTVYYVRDNGAGFDMQYSKNLFQPFRRLHENKEFPGTGIGLATVKRIIQRHRGRLWAEAAVDQGATFYFTLAEISAS